MTVDFKVANNYCLRFDDVKNSFDLSEFDEMFVRFGIHAPSARKCQR